MIVQVRFLFSFAGGTGHYLPTAPFARALRRLGHQVLYSCQEAMVDLVAADGWEVQPSGGRTLIAPDQRLALVPVDRSREEAALGRFAGRTAGERTGRLIDVAQDWSPDVMVSDEMDFGAALAAHLLGIPHVSVIVLAAGGLARPGLIAAPLSEVGSAYGLEALEVMAALEASDHLAPLPPGLRSPEFALGPSAHWARPAVLDEPTSLPRTHGAGRGRGRAYFSLGTIFHQESGDLFSRVLVGLSSLPLDVLVTVGREIDPTEVGPQPDHIRVERFVPLADALGGADVVVCHGGSGTVIAALALGLPLVLLPMGADQPWNADRCAELGVARVLDPLACSPADVAGAVADALGEPSYRQKALQLRKECLALPSTREVAGWLEELAGAVPGTDRGHR